MINLLLGMGICGGVVGFFALAYAFPVPVFGALLLVLFYAIGTSFRNSF